MFQVVILNARLKAREDIIFDNQASSVVLPGVDGEFEILDFHKPIISRLKKGTILVDNNQEYLIEGGVAKMDRQSLVAIVDL